MPEDKLGCLRAQVGGGEVVGGPAVFCPQAIAEGFPWLKKNPELDA